MVGIHDWYYSNLYSPEQYFIYLYVFALNINSLGTVLYFPGLIQFWKISFKKYIVHRKIHSFITTSFWYIFPDKVPSPNYYFPEHYDSVPYEYFPRL